MLLLKRSNIPAYIRLTRLDKPIGIYLLLWPTLWALWIAAEGLPSIKNLIIFCCGVVLMRSAGCVINDFADRDIDKHVKRTAKRPITSGEIEPREALTLFGCLLVLSFLLVLLTNIFTILLSFGALVLAACYPFAKRFTSMPQVVLGAAFSWAIPMAFAAENNSLTPIAWLLFTTSIIWIVVYDTLYAMVDRDDDLKIGVKSTAILFGEQDKFFIGVLQFMTIFALALLGQRAELGVFYTLSLFVAAGLFIYQQRIIVERDRNQCFKAFLNNNFVGMAVFVGIFLHYLTAN
jgi:4-hydroxybenzoate polyprenyltransferase